MSANRLWTCMKCSAEAPAVEELAAHKGFSFSAPKPEGRAAPVCPKCGLDGGDPDLKDWIAPLVVNHYEPPHAAGIPNKGCGKLACTGRPARESRFIGTGDPRLVTCPACRATDAFQKALAAIDDAPESRLPDAPASTPTVTPEG